MWTSNHKILLNQIIHPRDRVALVGRNGSGKSTLLKILHGLVAQDEGERMLSKGLSIGYMEQDPNLSEFSTLYDYVYSGVSENDLHLVEMTSQNLGVDLEAFNIAKAFKKGIRPDGSEGAIEGGVVGFYSLEMRFCP